AQHRSAPRATTPPTRTQRKIITAHSPTVTHRHAEINYGPECLPEQLCLALPATVATTHTT
ncbi:MAG: hypothetical protein ACRDRB_25285, partial [Pseudonocardiaceae bacterium]